MTSGYSVPCARKSTLPEPGRLLLEDVDERRADDLPLLLGIDHARQPIEKQRRRIDEHQRQLQPLESLSNLRRFVVPQDAVVHEDARQPVADRAVKDHRGDRRIDAAAQAADHPSLADLAANLRRRFFDKRRHRPVAGAAADAVGEVAEDLEAALGVDDFRVKQQCVEPPRRVRHRGDRRVGARRGDGESVGRRRDEIAMARPDADLVGHARKQRRRRSAACLPAIVTTACPNSRCGAGATVPPSEWAINCMP